MRVSHFLLVCVHLNVLLYQKAMVIVSCTTGVVQDVVQKKGGQSCSRCAADGGHTHILTVAIVLVLWNCRKWKALFFDLSFNSMQVLQWSHLLRAQDHKCESVNVMMWNLKIHIQLKQKLNLTSTHNSDRVWQSLLCWRHTYTWSTRGKRSYFLPTKLT